MKFLNYTFKRTIDFRGFQDLTDLLRKHHQETYSSLAFMCQKFLGLTLSKYEQRSNWNRRPLQLRQMHYAALDAYLCLVLYDRMRQPSPEGECVRP